jgi:hypothetical protein
VTDSPPVETDLPPVETDLPPVETDLPPVETDPKGGVNLPFFIPKSTLNVMRQNKPDLVELGDLFHSPYTEESIFTPNRTSPEKGGMMQNSNAVDAIVRLLRGT